MPFTQADVDSLNAQIVSAERQVTIGNQSVTFRPLADLIKARDLAMRELASVPRKKVSYLYQDGRGFDDGLGSDVGAYE